MSNGLNRQDAAVKCPFYAGCSGKIIECSGGPEEGCKTTTRFRTAAAREKYMRHFCDSCATYPTCVIAKATAKAMNFEFGK